MDSTTKEDCWDNYCTKTDDGENVFISYNQSIDHYSDLSSHNTLLKIAVYLKTSVSQGISQEDFLTLCDIEDELTSCIFQNGGIYIGRVTFDDLRVFHYYLDKDTPFFMPLMETLQKKHNYVIKHKFSEDPEKKTYYEFLMPTDDEMEDQCDHRVINILMDEGDTFTCKREICYWLYFKKLSDVDNFIAWAKTENFLIKGVNHSKNVYELVVGKEGIPTIDYIKDIQNNLKEAALNFNGLYEGWETYPVT